MFTYFLCSNWNPKHPAVSEHLSAHSISEVETFLGTSPRLRKNVWRFTKLVPNQVVFGNISQVKKSTKICGKSFFMFIIRYYRQIVPILNEASFLNCVKPRQGFFVYTKIEQITTKMQNIFCCRVKNDHPASLHTCLLI